MRCLLYMDTRGKILYGGLRALGRELAKEEWQGAKYVILVDENTFRYCLPLLIGGAVWLGGSLFGEDDDDYIGDAADAVRISEKQREILSKELFG